MALRMWVLIVAWALFVWWVVARFRSNRVTAPFVVIWSLVFVFLSWQTWLEYTWQHNEKLYIKAIAPITGPGKDVHCQRILSTFLFAGTEAGHVMYNADGTISRQALLTYRTCHDLGAFMASSKKNPTLGQIAAVHVLTHEAEHLAGIKIEAAAECKAMQDDYGVALRLGASSLVAKGIQLRYAREIYPQMPDDYRSRDCVLPHN